MNMANSHELLACSDGILMTVPKQRLLLLGNSYVVAEDFTFLLLSSGLAK